METEQAVTLQRCFAYARVSGPSQTGEGKDGLPRQRREIEKWAAEHNYTISEWFEERGVPGKTDFDNRPALKELVSRTQFSGTPRVVIVERLDRLARDLMVQETIMGDFRRRGIEIVSTKEPDVCSSDPTRVFIRQVFGALAEYDKNMIVQKLRAAREAKRLAMKRCEGGKPYGEHDKFPEERAGLVIMEDLRRAGASFREISEEMTRRGYRIRRGAGRWNPGTIMRILKRRGIA